MRFQSHLERLVILPYLLKNALVLHRHTTPSPVLWCSLGLVRDLREPDEIFYAVLDEGDEITLASNLKVRRGSIHSEPAIELSGADPYKFAELRELGLINEQINWKQRFFLPSDETSGIDILESLLERYPVILTEDEASDGEASATGDSATD